MSAILSPVARKPGAQASVIPEQQPSETRKVSKFVTEEKSILPITSSDPFPSLADFELEKGFSLIQPEETISRPHNPEPDPSKPATSESSKKIEDELRRFALSNLKNKCLN